MDGLEFHASPPFMDRSIIVTMVLVAYLAQELHDVFESNFFPSPFIILFRLLSFPFLR
jgi:hypothetical protein